MSEDMQLIMSKLDGISVGIVKLNERVDRVEQVVSEIKQDVAVLKEDVAVLKREVTVLKEDVAVLKEDVAVLKEDVAVLKEDVAVLKQEVTVLKQDVSTLKQDVISLNDRVGHVEQEVHDLKLIVENDVSKKINVIAEGHFFVLQRLEEVRKGQEDREKMALDLIDLRAEIRQMKKKVGIA